MGGELKLRRNWLAVFARTNCRWRVVTSSADVEPASMSVGTNAPVAGAGLSTIASKTGDWGGGVPPSAGGESAGGAEDAKGRTGSG